MFCPKCGNQLPDGSAFCGQCGAKLQAPAAGGPVAPRAAGCAGAHATTAPSGGGVRPTAIAAAVLAAVAVIVSLLSWFEVYPGYTSVTSYVDQAASFLGVGTSSSLAFSETYAPWALPGFAGTFGEYASLYGSLGGSGASGVTVLVALLSWVCAALWLASAVLLVWGTVAALTGRGRVPMVVGAVAAVLCWLAFLVFSNMASQMGDATAMPVVFVLAAIAAGVCSIAAGKKA